MHGHTSKSTTRRPSRRSRRGSVLILVVGVLVLLAISAAVYVGVGQQERLAASASEMKSHRDAVSAKIIDYLGQILVRDLFGNDAQARFPFEDRIAPLGFGGSTSGEVMGERWDYPYTRPGNSTIFNVLADAWLASTEPVDSTGDGKWDIWPHISNIHPQGKFVSIAKFFTGFSGNGGAFYGDLTIGGANAEPYRLDTYTNANGADPFVYFDQMGRQVIGEADDSIVTWADRQLGADTDGDGRIDARWTELPDVYGLPKGMRILAGVRFVDASSMFNINANLEFGASTVGDTSSAVGLGRTPADIDLYTAMLDSFTNLQGAVQPNDTAFIDGAGPGRAGFRQHLFNTGIQSEILGLNNYAPQQRTTRSDRETFWNLVARNPYRPQTNFAPYGVDDEMELRTFMFTVNDRATSRLEQTFDGLNFKPSDASTWLSPLRNRSFIRERVDYSQQTPDIITLQNDFRHLLTTYNGSMPVRPWNRGYAESDAPAAALNINALLASNSTSTPQTLTGAFMWALAPYAVDVGNADGSDAGRNVFGSPVVWLPTNSNEELHYGNGDAGYAYFKSAQLAVNTVDYFDSDNTPTIRTLRFGRTALVPNRGDKDILGVFDHGRVPQQMASPSGTENNTTITVIGLERQPFIREVCAVNVYGNLDDNLSWDYTPPKGAEEEWMVKILAVELGNPWPSPISTKGCRIKFGNDALNSWSAPTVTIPAGGSVILYVGVDNPLNGIQPEGRAAWKSIVEGRMTDANVYRIGDDSTHLEFESASGGELYDEITLWRAANYGPSGMPDVLIDRIRPASQVTDFPNIITKSGLGLPGGVNGPDTEFIVRVGSIRRYCGIASGSASSFPGYVFQSPASIAANGHGSDEHNVDAAQNSVPVGLIASALGPDAEFINSTSNSKGYGTAPTFAPFALHVPNLDGNSDESDKTFRSSVDLLMVSSVGNIHCQQLGAIDDPDFTNKSFYITASELLGDETLRIRMAADLANAGVPNIPVLLDIIRPAGPAFGGAAIWPADFRFNSTLNNTNRFVGHLDYTRFIPHTGSSAMIHEALPLATRIIDAFDTVSVDSNVPLVQGRININTAPRRVLEALPFVDPRYQAGPIPDRTNTDLRIAEAILAYRDRAFNSNLTLDWSSDTRAQISNLTLPGGTSGLRDDATSRGVAANERMPGFTTPGELLLATRWQPRNGGPSNDVDPIFVGNNLAYQTPYAAGLDGQNLTYEPLDPDGFSIDPAWRTTANYDPTDDVSEQLALVRAIRNCVSTRSDVFIAYITLVGFTPDDIQRAEDGGGSITQKLTRLQASLEQRYVVVFDRSGVKSPTDRPRILFAAQEVPSR